MDLKALSRATYPHERLFAGYLLVVAGFFAASDLPDRWTRVLVHLAICACFLFAFPLLGNAGWRTVLRHWLPLPFLAFVYLELDVLNKLFAPGFHDASIIALEQSVFHSQPSIVLRELIPFRPLSEYLHLGYFSYYFLFPILGVSLFLRRDYAAYRYAATVVLGVFWICYTIFIFYPVGGPWNHFDRPAVAQVGYIVPPIVHRVLVNLESVGTAFPSSHVAVATAVWLLSARLDRRVFRLHAFLVPALIIGTVYGGFHYAVDSLVGIAIGLAVVLLGPRINRALGEEAPAPRQHS